MSIMALRLLNAVQLSQMLDIEIENVLKRLIVIVVIPLYSIKKFRTQPSSHLRRLAPVAGRPYLLRVCIARQNATI